VDYVGVNHGGVNYGVNYGGVIYEVEGYSALEYWLQIIKKK
jgi:hypothetical protein